MRGLILSPVVALVVFACAATAAAQPRPVAVAEDFSGDLHVIGDGVAWAETTCVFGCRVEDFEFEHRFAFFHQRRGGRSRLISRVVRRMNSSAAGTVGFAASPTHLVRVSHTNISGENVTSSSSSFEAGPLRER